MGLFVERRSFESATAWRSASAGVEAKNEKESKKKDKKNKGKDDGGGADVVAQSEKLAELEAELNAARTRIQQLEATLTETSGCRAFVKTVSEVGQSLDLLDLHRILTQLQMPEEDVRLLLTEAG